MQKTVVIVEDDDEQRTFYQNALRRRGFRAEGAAKVAEAYCLIEQLGEEIDVMLLDMRLLDPEAPTTTGADVAIRVRDEHPNWMPEYVVKTAFPYEVNYYRLALCLGVAAYLAMDEVSEADVLRHIRALALKRSLRIERPKVLAALNSISESTKSLSDAVVKFCTQMLAKELNACLGTPYILLLSDDRGTQNVATNTDLPIGYETSYSAIQEMAHGITKPAAQYVISKDDTMGFPTPTGDAAQRIFGRLPGAALLPLAKVMNFKLSLALFKAENGESKLPEETGPLASVLAQHVRPSIVEHFLGILVQLDAQRKAMLKSTSHFCLYVGQEQQRIINDGINNGELPKESGLHYTLATMADDLRRTGAILSSAVSDRSQQAQSVFEMKDIVESEFANLRQMIDSNDISLRLEGSCQVSAGDDLAIAVKRLLQWLIQRRTETPPALKPEIYVQCVEREDESRIIFEDRSRRLPKDLREQLFEPFSTSVILDGACGGGPGLYLPLYLAKMLVEEKYGGRLSDESDAKAGDVGHTLMMCFSPPVGSTSRTLLG